MSLETLSIDGKTEWHGSNSNVVKEGTMKTMTPSEWEEMWEQYIGEPCPGMLPPDAMGVSVFLGERSTTGYGVQIYSVKEEKNKIRVKWEEKKPHKSTRVRNEITQPWQIILTPKSEKPISIEEEQKVDMRNRHQPTLRPRI